MENSRQADLFGFTPFEWHMKMQKEIYKKERKTMQEQKIYIVDDGTLDTVVSVNGELIRFDSEYRFSFDNDEEFLDDVRQYEIDELEYAVRID